MAAQFDYRYSLDVSGHTVFDVVSFDLQEALSSPFHLSLSLASSDPEADFASIIDQPATFTFYQQGEAVRYVHGIVTELEQKKTGFHRTFYAMTIQPALSRADLQSDCRIFQMKDSREMIAALLKKNGIHDYRFDLKEDYWKREYCVQYNETDLQFMERLLAEDGTYYYFEHRADGHTLCMVNDSFLANSIGEVDYNARPATGERPFPGLRSFSYRQKVATSQQTQRDYTFKNPNYAQEHSAYRRDSVSQGDYEKYQFPGRYKRDAQGKPFTQYRLEYERREAVLATGKGDDQRLLTGHTFTLTGHDRSDMNRSWLVIGLNHHGEQPGVLGEEAGNKGNHYQIEARFIPSDRQWRPTPIMKPTVEGPQIGHVVGPANEEIYCDEWGRVKIQFPWDREGQSNEFSSCWIRVSQAWAGAQFGNIAIPRIGHEIIVDFLEGDPDQPIVTGRTYHQTTLPPYNLPEHKTRMSIQSKTHKGDGFNELRFEDEKDQEEVFIHAQKDQNNVVNNDETTRVGRDRTEAVGQDEKITIARDRRKTVGQDEFLNVQRDLREHVYQDAFTTVHRNETRTIKSSQKEIITADHIATIGGHETITIEGIQSIEAKTRLKTLTKEFLLSGTDKIVIRGPNGTIRFTAAGIEIETPKLEIKANVSISGGSSKQLETLQANIEEGLPFVEECPLKDNKEGDE